TTDSGSEGGDGPVPGEAAADIEHQRLPDCRGCCKFYGLYFNIPYYPSSMCYHLEQEGHG
ncbi:jg26260, partial [Pararge aegeria aegeria]